MASYLKHFGEYLIHQDITNVPSVRSVAGYR